MAKPSEVKSRKDGDTYAGQDEDSSRIPRSLNEFSTFDVALGYDTALHALGHEVYSFAYHRALRFYRGALEVYHDDEADIPKGAEVALASEQVAVIAVDFRPDVALIVAGLNFGARGYQLLNAMGIPTAILLTESPYLDYIQINMARAAQATILFTNDRASVGPLVEDTGQPVTYLPHSFDPARHYPQEVGPEFQSDVFFHGTLWPEREALFSQVRGMPYRMHLDGIDPHAVGEAVMPSILQRVMSNDAVARHYSGAAIALNHHRTCVGGGDELEHIEAGEAWSLGPRAFEIAACGAFQLCDDARPELGEVFGDSVATYRNAEHLKAQVAYYMQHPAERREMAEESRHCVEGCSFMTRAETILIPALEEVI